MNTLARLSFGAAFMSLTLVACGANPPNIPLSPEPNPEPKNTNPPQKAEVYSSQIAVRVEEFVRRQYSVGCDGRIERSKLKSRGTSPVVTHIVPREKFKIESAVFRNKLNNKSVMPAGLNEDFRYFFVSLDGGFFGKSLEVVPGKNPIEYVYETCVGRGTHSRCLEYQVAEQGEVILNVLLRRRVVEECKREPICRGDEPTGYKQCEWKKSDYVIEDHWNDLPF